MLKLDGSDGTYAEFPKGLFDGRDKLTVQMDVKSEINKNQFTFAFGQNSTKYYFLKYNNSGELASRITTNSYGAEDAANATLSGNGAWHRVTVTLDDNVMTVYSDGAQVAQNKATKNKVTDLGNDLLAYLASPSTTTHTSRFVRQCERVEPRAHCSGGREDQPDCSAGYFCGHCAV